MDGVLTIQLEPWEPPYFWWFIPQKDRWFCSGWSLL